MTAESQTEAETVKHHPAAAPLQQPDNHVASTAAQKSIVEHENTPAGERSVCTTADSAGSADASNSAFRPEAFHPKDVYTRERCLSSMTDGTAKEDAASKSDVQHQLEIAGLVGEEEHGLAGTNMNDEAVLPPPLPCVEHPWFEMMPLEGIPSEANILDHDIHLLHKAHHADPFSVLGPHFFNLGKEENKYVVVRLWKKDAKNVNLRPIQNHYFTLAVGAAAASEVAVDSVETSVGGASSSVKDRSGWVPAIQRCEWLYQRAFKVSLTKAGETQLKNSNSTFNQLLEATHLYYSALVSYHGDPTEVEYEIRDAYNFGILASEYDLKLFQGGSCWHVDNLMGSHIMEINNVRGVRFVVWAPNAVFLSVVGGWNQWDGRANPMRRRSDFGIWEIFVPNIGKHENYCYRIHTKAGQDIIKIDPYAQLFQNPPSTASVVSDCDDAYKGAEERFKWTDEEWIDRRCKLAKENQLHRMPMSIYEVHLPSWMRGDDNAYLGYRELADRLVAHLKFMNFTHVEFLPLAHHPFEGSWGYQISGQYAPYSRLGSADDLKYLINELHKNNIGVLLDLVPAHFVKDSWGLINFDGEACYEYSDPREGELKGWGTMLFNFRRNEVRSFLLGACYHWLRRYHLDGLRIDAVSSMIYKNHCRDPGDWLPNEFGGDANLQAISLLQELNWVVHREFLGVFTIAEESTAWPGVTDKDRGLGFDAKWDLGWMNDTFSYLTAPAMERWKKHQKLTFRGLYMANEKWVLPLSHDEVVSGKGSLLDKCGFRGTSFEERLKTLRALFGLQVCMPGRPLLFMGSEFAQGREWNESRSIDWHECHEHEREKVLHFVSDLLKVYKTEPALHAGDDEIWNFQWVDCDNAQDNVLAWIRKYGDWHNDVLAVVNFSGVKYYHYSLGVPHGGRWTVLVNSDDWKYGGAMGGPGPGCQIQPTQGGRFGWPYCLWIDLPSHGVLVLKAPKPTEG